MTPREEPMVDAPSGPSPVAWRQRVSDALTALPWHGGDGHDTTFIPLDSAISAIWSLESVTDIQKPSVTADERVREAAIRLLIELDEDGFLPFNRGYVRAAMADLREALGGVAAGGLGE